VGLKSSRKEAKPDLRRKSAIAGRGTIMLAEGMKKIRPSMHPRTAKLKRARRCIEGKVLSQKKRALVKGGSLR